MILETSDLLTIRDFFLRYQWEKAYHLVSTVTFETLPSAPPNEPTHFLKSLLRILDLNNLKLLTSRLIVGQHQVCRAHIINAWFETILAQKSSLIGFKLFQTHMNVNLTNVTVIMITILKVMAACTILKWAWHTISGRGPYKTRKFLIPHTTIP